MPSKKGNLSRTTVDFESTMVRSYRGDRPDIFTDPAAFETRWVTAEGYTTMDLAASYTLLKDALHLQELTLFGKTQNLFDREFQQVFGFSAPGITYLFGLKGTL